MEHRVFAKTEDEVVNRTTSCFVKLQNELASGIIIFWGSEDGMKPLLHRLSIFVPILASLLIGLTLTCHRKTPSKLCKRSPALGSLPSSSGPMEGFWLTLPWNCPSCAWPLNAGEGAVLWSWGVWAAVTPDHAGVVRGRSSVWRRILGPKQRHPPYHVWYFREYNIWGIWTFFC